MLNSSITGIRMTGGFMTNNQPLTGGTFDAIRKKIKDWILEQQCKFTPTKRQGWVWSYTVEKGGYAFSVYQLTGRSNSIFIAVSADLDDYQQRIENLPEKERMELLFEIRFALLNVDVEFDIPNDELKTVEIYWQIFSDKLTQAEFWEKVFQVQKALLAIVWVLERKFL
jgi:hypothetical protein